MKKNKVAKKLLFVGWAILLLMGVVLAVFWNSLPPQIPWFYSLSSGELQLVDKLVLAAIMAGMAVILGVTKLLASWASKGDIPAESTLMVGAVITILIFAAGFFRVIQIFAL